MRARSLILTLGVAVAMGIPMESLARADNTTVSKGAATTDESRALDLFEKSEAMYDAGRFADALALLRQSYELKKEPILLYNMGRAHEGLGELASAVDSYEAFLKAQPNAPDRATIERRVAMLRHELADREALKRRAEKDRARGGSGSGSGSGADTKKSTSMVPWIVVGLGAAGLAGGGVVGVLGNQRNAQAKDEPTYVEAARLHSEAESFSKVANICFIAGGVVLIGGIIWALIDNAR